MTATPKVYNGDLNNIISMDKEKYYGSRIYKYNTSDAICGKYLTDYKIMNIYTKNASIEKSIKSNKLVKYQEDLEEEQTHYIATAIVLLKKIQDGTCNHMLTYHNRIKSAKKFSKLMYNVNNIIYDKQINILYLDGNMSMNKRARIIREYKNSDKAILCSARILNEGVNISVVDSICFVDTRFSTIDIVQCIGRSLRLHQRKKMAYIIVPIFVDELSLDITKTVYYDNIMRILHALKNTDDNIIEYFKMISNNKLPKRQLICGEYFDKKKYATEINIEHWNDLIDIIINHTFIKQKKASKIDIQTTTKNIDKHLEKGILIYNGAKIRVHIDVEKEDCEYCEYDIRKIIANEMCENNIYINNLGVINLLIESTKERKDDFKSWYVNYVMPSVYKYIYYKKYIPVIKDNVSIDNYIMYKKMKIHTIIDINDIVWFNAKQITLVLNYKDTIDAIKTKINKEDKKQLKYIDYYNNNTASYHPNSIYINEAGMYSLIFSSKMKEAINFKEWVTRQVLPSIRKYG